MTADEMNSWTYEETDELKRNPEIVCKDAQGNEFRIVDWDINDAGIVHDPMVLRIERVQ